MIDHRSNGIQLITDTLAARNDISAIHIFSHGADGAVYLGQNVLDSNFIEQNKDQISRWGSALNEDADLLIYGCDVAGSESGKALINALARLTGADAAASDDATGSASLGANWGLEFAVGPIETPVAVSSQFQVDWLGLLNAFSVTNTGNSGGGGSLRQAILDANALAGPDTITFSIPGAGLHTISPTSALPTVTDAVVIDGTTQAGFAGAPLIQLNGSLAGNSNGLVIAAGNSTVRGLVIDGFSKFGLSLITAGSNVIEGNYIGTNAAGTAALANVGDWIHIETPND